MTRRDVSPLEQHVHSFLELVPLAAVMLLTLLYWPQVKALCGLEIALNDPSEAGAPGARVHRQCASGNGSVRVLPYGEELCRDLRTHRDDFGPGRQFRGPI